MGRPPGEVPSEPKPPPDPIRGARFLRRVAEGPPVRVVELVLPEAIDSEEFDGLNAALLAEVDSVGAGRCVLDLTAVDYMGSSMLGLMVNARQRVKAGGGRLVLCGLSPWLAGTFRTCSLDRLFVTVATREEAVKLAGKR